MRRYDIAIAGAGLGGAILARALNQQGRRVILIERDRHPRFAIGESSTPLAALSLERLARDYGLEDLHQLANYARWSRHHKQLGRGLKRGFTFYDHRAGDPRSRARSTLLVAASPNDAVADAHWLRQDIDHYLVRQACREGVEYHDRCRVTELTTSDSGVDLVLDTETSQMTIRASVLVDATGKSGLVSKRLNLPAGPKLRTRSSLLYSHFHDLPPLVSDAAESARHPYPEQWAAVHHILKEGWLYELRFDDGLVSAGALLRRPPPGDPAAAWRELLSPYPALRERFGAARSTFPIRAVHPIQHRMVAASGQRWVALPHTFGFVDPLFSSGIAWTLRAVERLAVILGESTLESRLRQGSAFDRYAALLERELDQIDALASGAYAAMVDFELFAAYSMAYFAAASWAEVRQRLLDPAEAMWESFLGSDDPELARLFHDARAALPPPDSTASDRVSSYWRWISRRIARRDIAGLDRWGRTLRVPVDLDVLVERAELLGLSQETVRARLPLLRGQGETD